MAVLTGGALGLVHALRSNNAAQFSLKAVAGEGEAVISSLTTAQQQPSRAACVSTVSSGLLAVDALVEVSGQSTLKAASMLCSQLPAGCCVTKVQC